MSTDVAVAVQRAAVDVPFFWIDDVYVTGLIPQRLGRQTVRHIDIRQLYSLSEKLVPTNSSRWRRSAVFWHVARGFANLNAKFRSLWSDAQRRDAVRRHDAA